VKALIFFISIIMDIQTVVASVVCALLSIICLIAIIIFILKKKTKSTHTNDDTEANLTPIRNGKHHNKPNLSLLLRLSVILAEEGVYSKPCESHSPNIKEEEDDKPNNSILSKSLNDAFCSENNLDSTPSTKSIEESKILAFSPICVDVNNDNYIIMQKQRLSILMSDNIICYE
jgi:hypothetical protein